MLHNAMTPRSIDQAKVANLIDWLRHTRLETVMAEAAQILADGASEDDLWAACALTATRYLNNQARNLLGFVSHAMIGCEDARRLAVGQSTRTRYLLLLQSLYQTVLDLYDPCFAPWELVSFWPLHEKDVAESIKQLRIDMRFGEYMRVDHRFVGLAETLPQADLVDLLLDIGLEGMTTDDHTVISPVLSLGMIDLVGWEAGFDMLRWSVRYSSSFPIHREPYDRAVELMRSYDLQQGVAQTAFQPELVQSLRTALLAATSAERPELVAQAMSDRNYSPETVVAAASLTACDMYLMVDPVPHADYDAISREVAPIHIGNALRLLRTALPYMAPRTQALAAIQAGSMVARGPSVLNCDFCFVPFEPARAYPYAEDVARWTNHPPQHLLASLHDALHAHDCRSITALVRAYADQNVAAEPLITLLTEVAATDNGTLLHNIKHLNSMVLEFRECAQPDRWNYLTQAAKFVGWYAGLTTEAYTLADQALTTRLA
jgi:hypothetical protein